MEPSKSLRGGARTKSVGTKLTEEEFARIESLAAGSGRTLSEWIRERLLGAASGQASSLAPGLAPVPAAEGGVRVADEILLSEVLALRAILLNLLYDMATGEALVQTANTDVEYMHWDNRRAALEKKAGAIADQEMDPIVTIATRKMEEYAATV